MCCLGMFSARRSEMCSYTQGVFISGIQELTEGLTYLFEINKQV